MLQTFRGNVFWVTGCFYFAAQRGRKAPRPWGLGGKIQRCCEEIKMLWPPPHGFVGGAATVAGEGQCVVGGTPRRFAWFMAE